MKVWILQTGEPLPTDGGSPRPMRAMNLAAALSERGHDVVLWSSAFYHQEKRHRTCDFQQIPVSERLTVNLVPSPGYSRNIGPDRLYDHAILGVNLKRLLESNRFPAPDVAFIGFPPIESAAVMTHWLRDRAVPVMVDAKDQWPTIFLEPLPSILRPIGRLALLPYFYLAKRTFRDASAFCSMSDEFIDWMCRLADRGRGQFDHAAPLTSPLASVSRESLSDATAWWRDCGVDTSNDRRVAFVGSLSSAFDFSIVARLAKRCLENRVESQFVICGHGDQAGTVATLMKGLGNVVMPGWIDSPKIAALMASSRAVVAPYVNNDAFSRSIPNKIVDGFSTGRPVLTTLSGLTARILHEHQAGIGSESEDALFGELSRLMSDSDYFEGVSLRARALYESQFSFDKIYGDLVDALTRLASAK
jgi:glycosyltransferase involved in cell wall biosynthesis